MPRKPSITLAQLQKLLAKLPKFQDEGCPSFIIISPAKDKMPFQLCTPYDEDQHIKTESQLLAAMNSYLTEKP